MLSKLRQILQNPWIKYGAQITIILLIFYSIKVYKQQDIVKGLAPDFNEVLLDGQQIKLSNYRGKSVLIHFWATWCPICNFEQNSIEAISKDNKIITVAMNSGEAMEIQTFMEKNNLSFPVIIDEDGLLAQRYGVTGVPTSFILNPEGIIEYTEIGYTTNWGLRARLWLAN
ncbi:MAG: protein disulfide oxidoreductase [Thiohalomonadales bacterium]